MRWLLVLPLLLVSAATAVLPTVSSQARTTTASARPAPAPALDVVRMAADSLVARHQPMPAGGWAWRSAIQAPHFHTDRDVGAASIGEGLLAAYAVTSDPRYLHAAARAGDYLLGVAEPAAGGLRWPDWADPDGRRSETHFTSFDDGAAGISDFLWNLSVVTREPRFRVGALGGMRWLLAQAKGRSCPERACFWRWTDDPSWRVAYNGVGMGQAGIVWTLDAFADRTGVRSFRVYARSGAARLRKLTENGRSLLPEGSESAASSTGFLSGSAGAASMFLERYAHDRIHADLVAARRLLSGLNDQAITDPRGGLRWRLDSRNASSAAGFELGAAGVAWVNLQAYRALGDTRYREVARRAARWLRSVAIEGGAWAEQPDVAGSPVRVGLDSGIAGIAWVLDDLARAGVDSAANRAVARAALGRLRAEADSDRLGAFWYESRTRGRPNLRAEPSWHWGTAGIAAFAARLEGWSGRGPGGQPLSYRQRKDGSA